MVDNYHNKESTPDTSQLDNATSWSAWLNMIVTVVAIEHSYYDHSMTSSHNPSKGHGQKAALLLQVSRLAYH